MNSYLDEVEAQLVELTERGAHRRARLALVGGGGGPGRGPRRLVDAFAVAVVVAVAVAVAAVVLSVHPAAHHSAATSQHHHAITSPPHHHHARPGPVAHRPHRRTAQQRATGVPAGFVPRSFTAISELTWWLLGTAPCAAPPCTAIVHTTDGGRTFSRIPAPRAPLIVPPRDVPGISQLRFADARDGFAYGPDLFATHDGGETWSQLDAGRVTDLAIANGIVYATVESQATGGGSLIRSPADRDQWVTLKSAGNVDRGLWAHGADLFVQSPSRDELLVSHDGGGTFAAYRSPSDLPCAFQEQAPPVLWARCNTGMASAVWRSSDSGRSFQLTSCCGTRRNPAPMQPNSAAFAAASSTTAVFGYQQLYRTSDGGGSWAPVGPPGLTWSYLGFTDPTHGIGLAGSSPSEADAHLYYTTDGGASYHLVPIR